MRDLMTISSGALPSYTRVIGFRGIEAISRLFRFEVYLTIKSESDVDFAQAIGEKVVLTIDREDDKIPPYLFGGILGSLDLIHEFGGRALIRAVIVPEFSRLSLSEHSRIFTKKSIVDVIKLVLAQNGVTRFELRLTQSYETEEHICQYRESDFDFLSRWMEREGIYYCFEHSEAGDKLILRDDKAYQDEALGKPVRYHPQPGGDDSAGMSFRSFSCINGALPAEIKLRDYDYMRPNLTVFGTASVSPKGAGEVSIYGDRFFSPGVGERLAKLFAEEYLARQTIFLAGGTRYHMRAGHTFEVDYHPRARFNTKYLAIEVRHQGNQATGEEYFKDIIGLTTDEVYFVDVTAIPATTQFRAESKTPWPRIYGFENGVVDAPGDSEYAQIDEQGRYLARLFFDENQAGAGTGSTYIRMMQPHGGGIEGFHFPLRKGTEIVVSFLGGDPDRPVISGVVPNALTPSPVTSGNHTKNVIQTGGRNRLELEDLAGSQRVTLSTPYANSYVRMGSPNEDHELIMRTDENTLLDTGKNFDTKVGIIGGSGNWDIDVKNNVQMDVLEGDLTTNVVLGKMTTTVKGDITTTSQKGDFKTTAETGSFIEKAQKDITVTAVTGKLTETAETGIAITSNTKNIDVLTKDGDVTIEAKGNIVLTAHGHKNEITKKDHTIIRRGDFAVETYGTVKSTTMGQTETTNVGAFISTTIGASADTKIGPSLALTLAANMELKASITVELSAGAKLSSVYGFNVESTFGVKIASNYTTAIETKFGASVSIKNSVEFSFEGPKFKKGTGPDIKSLPIAIRQKALDLEKNGFKIVT